MSDWVAVSEGFGFNAYLYGLLYETISGGGHKLARRVPDFIIKESIRYFEQKEQYEKCSVIRSFFDADPKREFAMSRADWLDHGWRQMA